MTGTGISVLWFRHGLRLHDNPALLRALELANNGGQFMAVFIFDGESAGTKLVGYNRMQFLIDSLADLDQQLRNFGGQLHILQGSPTFVFRRLWEELAITSVSYEQDCEPIWRARDEAVELLCRELGIRCNEEISHTLWNPREIIDTNGGVPPLTYQMFLHTVHCLGPPPRPVADADFTRISFVYLPPPLAKEMGRFERLPTPNDFGIMRVNANTPAFIVWKGGETEALRNLEKRLTIEGDAFNRGKYLPNQMFPDLVGTSNISLSAHLRFGCLSVRKFYYAIHDHFSIRSDLAGPHLTGQLIWREYFYTMSVGNPNYDRMEGNPICLNIPWAPLEQDSFEKWKHGRTGFPLIDAAMRQLSAEGWLHHTLRNAVATFLTRGALWFSWEHGLQYFLEHLLDADWSVCAGNWMWISSSAFEKLLDSSKCTCPIALGRRLDPQGEYIRRYLPELRNIPQQFIHQPWTMPRVIQEEAGCIIGQQYPEPMVNIAVAGERNSSAMREIRHRALRQDESTSLLKAHCRPSNDEEICKFFWLSDGDENTAKRPIKAN